MNKFLPIDLLVNSYFFLSVICSVYLLVLDNCIDYNFSLVKTTTDH